MTERMIYNAESFRILSVAEKRLTLQPERPYAKRGSARMNDTLPELQKTEAAPALPVAVDKEKEKKEIEQNPRFKALNERVKAIDALLSNKKSSADLSAEELDEYKEQYTALHSDLTGIKLFTSPRLFLRALITAGPREALLKQRLEDRVGKEETAALKDDGLTNEAKKVKAAHIIEINDRKKVALKHAWERYFTADELKDQQLRESIESAISLGYLPDTNIAKRLVEKADLVLGEPTVEEAQSLLQTWEAYFSEEELRNPQLQHAIMAAAAQGYLPGSKAAKQLAETAAAIPDKDKLEDEIDNHVHVQKAWKILADKQQENKSLAWETLSEDERQEKVTAVVKKHLPEEKRANGIAVEEMQKTQERAVVAAHNIGDGAYKNSLGDIKAKFEILEKAGFSEDEIRLLMEAGVVAKKQKGRASETMRELYARWEATTDPQEKIDLRTEIETERGVNLEYNWYDEMLQQADVREASLHERIDTADATFLQDQILNPANGVLVGNIDRVAQNYAKRHPDIDPQTMAAHYRSTYADQLQAARDALTAGNLAEAKRIANDIATNIGQKDREYWEHEERYREQQASESQERRSNINNFDEVLDAIIASAPDDWGAEGRYPLYIMKIDENGNRVPTGEVDQGNFKRWVQERMVTNASFDPDAPIDFFSTVAIENTSLFRPVSLAQMIKNYDQFFRRKDGSKVLKELKDEITDMGWIDGFFRNADVRYRVGMTDDTKFGNLMIEIFAQNTPGRESTRTGLNALANIFMTDEKFDPDKKAGEGDMKIGIATESAFLFYYNMTDYDELKKLFSDHIDDYFSYDLMHRAITEAMEGRNRNPRDEEERERFIAEAGLNEILKLYDRPVGQKVNFVQQETAPGKPPPEKDDDVFVSAADKGAKVTGEENITKFLLKMNIFDPPMQNRLKQTIVRSMVKQIAGLEAGLRDDRFENLADSRSTKGALDYAEMRAHWLTHPLGAAARQDTGYAAINAMTKVTHFKHYLNKQADPGRAGGIGNPHEYPLLKSIAADPVTGVLTDKNVSTMQMIRALHNIRRDTSLSENERHDQLKRLLSEWTYKDLAWKQYAPQHMNNAFKEFHDRTSGKEIHVDSFASYDMYGHIVYDQSKMISEVQEGLIKPSRYRWATHRLNYHENRRELISQKGDNIVYRDSTLAEEMYGPQVLLTAAKMQLRDYENLLRKGTPDEKAKLQAWLKKSGLMTKAGRLVSISDVIDKKGRYIRTKDKNGHETITEPALRLLEDRDFSNIGRILTKAYLTNKFAAQLYSVSAYGRGHKFMDYGARELIIGGLSHIPAGIHVEDETDLATSHFNRWYFTDYDIQLMRKISGNEVWKNFGKGLLMDMLGGGAEGTNKGLSHFLKEIFRK
jgi:hypothetical protein